MYNFF